MRTLLWLFSEVPGLDNRSPMLSIAKLVWHREHDETHKAVNQVIEEVVQMMYDKLTRNLLYETRTEEWHNTNSRTMFFLLMTDLR